MADFTQYTDANGTTHTVKDAKAVRQFSTMPSASDYSGLFVVYTGTTTSDYTKGHRYLSDGTNWTDYGTAEKMSYDNSSSGLSATDVQGAVDELEEEKVSFDAFGEEKTATITDGVATFTAYEEAPVTELVAGIEPVQDLHGYDNPWPAGGGKNKLNYGAWQGVSVIHGTGVFENNGVTLTATGNDCYTADMISGEPHFPEEACVPISEGQTVTLSWEEDTNTDGGVYIFPNGVAENFVNTNNSTSKSLSYTAASGVTFVTFRLGVKAVGNTISYKNIQIEYGSTATTFAPYTNICPISGHTEMDIENVGKNLLDMTLSDIQSLNTSGTWLGSSYTLNGVTFTVNVDDDNNVTSISTSGICTVEWTIFNIGTINMVNNISYILNGITGGQSTTYRFSLIYTAGLEIIDYNGEKNFTASESTQSTLRLIARNVNVDMSGLTFYPMIRKASDTDATFEPYKGYIKEISFGQTVYGGELNVKTGVLTVKTANIASYNGETINEPWISSMDEYVSGATPTTGAQVVYTLANPSTIQLSREEVFQLIGQNNISADTGDVISCKYIPVGNDKACLVTDDDYGYMGGKDMALTTDGTDASIILNGTEMPIVLQSFLKSYFYQTGLRYKNLGSSFTDAQKTAIANGDFTDLWNGDYWVINGVNWRIVDNTDFQYNRGNTAFTKHGLIVMPDTLLVSIAAFLVDTADDSGNGYGNSGSRSNYRATCKTLIENAFGSDHIGTHREFMTNARGSSGASGWAWYDADVELPSESNILGQSVFGSSDIGKSGGRNIGSQYGQFMLFRLAPQWICRRQSYWLRDIDTSSSFTIVADQGGVYYDSPSASWGGLRPYFILVGTTS